MGKNTEFMSINHSILDNLIQNILVLLSEPTAFPYRKWVWSLRKAEKKPNNDEKCMPKSAITRISLICALS